MKILVTGGAGFIGSHLVDRLLDLGNEVTIWDNFTTGKKGNLNHRARCYDIGVDEIVPQRCTNDKFEVIFHLAGETRIQPSFEKPLRVHASNVTGTMKMLEMARLIKSRFVFAGSSSVYHDKFANPYTFSKQIAEDYATLWHKVYGVSVAVARFFNVYGPRQLEDGAYATVMGIFEKQYREGIPLTITGTGEQRRDFTHVLDIVDGLVGMSNNEWNGDIIDLGTGKNYSIIEIANMFDHPYEFIPKRPGEAWVTLADISHAQSQFGYAPSRSLKRYIDDLKTK